MSNYARLDENNVVINVECAEPEWVAEQPDPSIFVAYTDLNPAYIGGTFDSGFFYPPQPYPSWVKDEGVWAAPVSMPDDGGRYQWDETNQEWVELSD
jgi:hypothetical protein